MFRKIASKALWGTAKFLKLTDPGRLREKKQVKEIYTLRLERTVVEKYTVFANSIKEGKEKVLSGTEYRHVEEEKVKWLDSDE